MFFKIRWILKILKCAEFLKWNLQIDDLDYSILVTNNQFVEDSKQTVPRQIALS